MCAAAETYLEVGAASSWSWSSVPDASLSSTDDDGRFAAANAGCTTLMTSLLLLPGGPRRSSASIISMAVHVAPIDRRSKMLAGRPDDENVRMLGLHCSSFRCVPTRLAYIQAVACCQ